MRSETLSRVRDVVIRVVIGSFSVAALLGIIVLLAPGRFGVVQGRILLTTVAIGLASVLTLCYLGVAGTRHRWLGAVGAIAVAVATVCFLVILWGHWQQDPGRPLLRTFGVSVILALTSAQFSLLLAVVRAGGTVARVLRATLAAGTLLAGLLVAAVLGWDPGDGAARVIGAIAILDVLGTVIAMAIGVFGGDRHEVGRPLRVVVPEPWADRVRAEARASGKEPTELVIEALARHSGSVDACLSTPDQERAGA